MQIEYEDLYVGGILRYIPTHSFPFRTVIYYIITQVSPKVEPGYWINTIQIASEDPDYKAAAGISIRPNMKQNKNDIYEMNWITPEYYHEVMKIVFDPRCKAYAQ
jgi:hypothetical protein